MNNRRIRIAALLFFLIAPATLTLEAGKQPGSKTPLIITFRDCQGGFPSAAFLALQPSETCPSTADRIGSDWSTSYVDGEHEVEAFLGTQANSGNVLLNVARSTRGMLLDFTDCASSGKCIPPPSQIYTLSSIRIDATAVRKNGLLGMALNETMSVPARVTYQTTAGVSPGFIEFNPDLKGKTPCKGASDYVSATRTGEQSWEIAADPSRIGCVTLPDGAGWAGNYRFPFRFTVQVR
jgi:hypothetical protein